MFCVDILLDRHKQTVRNTPILSPLNLSLYNPEYLMSIFGVSERTEVSTGSAPQGCFVVKQKTQRLIKLKWNLFGVGAL